MCDLTLGVIYAIKRGNNGPRDNIISFLSKYTNSPPEVYTDSKLQEILQHCFIDYLRTADNPSADVYAYFDAKRAARNYREVYPKQAAEYESKFHLLDEDSEAIISALTHVGVIKDEKYINGFRDQKGA